MTDYADLVAALAAAREVVEREFADAKLARQADPSDEDARVRYVAARDELQAMRAVDRAGRGTSVGGDAVKSEG